MIRPPYEGERKEKPVTGMTCYEIREVAGFDVAGCPMVCGRRSGPAVPEPCLCPGHFSQELYHELNGVLNVEVVEINRSGCRRVKAFLHLDELDRVGWWPLRI